MDTHNMNKQEYMRYLEERKIRHEQETNQLRKKAKHADWQAALEYYRWLGVAEEHLTLIRHGLATLKDAGDHEWRDERHELEQKLNNLDATLHEDSPAPPTSEEQHRFKAPANYV